MSDVKLIEPRTLKGFRDYLPELMIPREWMLEQARRVYRSYGFAPIDTPALEYAEILLGKGGDESDKQLYRFQHGRHDIALRFDLTVPFARFAAQYIGELGTPFKRYHMGPVWRGENTQKGRYREFWQCDFDTIGTTSNAADIEVALVIHDLMVALGIKGFEIRVNSRLILNGLLEHHGVADKAVPILRSLDKLAKVEEQEVLEEMMRDGVHHSKAHDLIRMVKISADPTRTAKRDISDLRQFFSITPNAKASEGIDRLEQLVLAAERAQIPEKRIKVDLGIARGLDYYTGTVYETFLTDMPKIGSVCSGGRYDNLAGLYTKQSLPGVGASLGLDRLLAALEELKLLKGTTTPAPVFIVQFSADRIGEYQRMARSLRAAGIGAEVFPDAKKIGQQFQYAEKRGHKIGLIAGPDDFAAGTWNVKDLAKREEKKGVPDGEVVALVGKMLRMGTAMPTEPLGNIKISSVLPYLFLLFGTPLFWLISWSAHGVDWWLWVAGCMFAASLGYVVAAPLLVAKKRKSTDWYRNLDRLAWFVMLAAIGGYMIRDVFAISAVHVENATPLDVRLMVDGEAWINVPAHSARKDSLPRGAHIVSVMAQEGEQKLDEHPAKVESCGTYVLNIFAAQAFHRGEVVYGAPGITEAEGNPGQMVRSRGGGLLVHRASEGS